MRLRKVKNADLILKSHPEFVIQEPCKHKGRWRDAFASSNPVRLEIGAGKGQFIIETARRDPETNYIAIEKFDSVLVRILEKLLENPLDNVLLIQIDAAAIGTVFVPGEVERIYLNFSDPWPKRRQAKYRLTHPNFLNIYKSILQDEGKICFKTDNFAFFEYTMMSFNHDPDFRILDYSLDLTLEQQANVETEFEVRFKAQGKPIYYLEVSLSRSDT